MTLGSVLYGNRPFDHSDDFKGFTQVLCDPVDFEFAEVTNVPSHFSVPFFLWSSLIFWSLCLNSSMVGIGSLVPHTGETM